MEPITQDQYAKAIVKLMNVARGDTSGSRAAAQVLLSAYNGSAWQLNVTDLCSLDADNYQAAIEVIRGRKEIGYEPHEFIQDGTGHFEALWNQWKRYHVNFRWMRDCDECYGAGDVYEDEQEDTRVPCTRCGGAGLLEEAQGWL